MTRRSKVDVHHYFARRRWMRLPAQDSLWSAVQSRAHLDMRPPPLSRRRQSSCRDAANLAQRRFVCNVLICLWMHGQSNGRVMHGPAAGASGVAWPSEPRLRSVGAVWMGPPPRIGCMSTRRSGTSACNARPAGGHLDNLDVAVAKSRGLPKPSQLGPRRRW